MRMCDEMTYRYLAGPTEEILWTNNDQKRKKRKKKKEKHYETDNPFPLWIFNSSTQIP